MIQNLTTIVIEPRVLIREALVSLLASRSYEVVGNDASMADNDNSLLLIDAPRLVILGSLPVDEAARAARRIRNLWHQAKICFLFDRVSSADIQEVLASEIDGCIPLFASADMLLDTLQTIIAADFRVLILKTEMCLSAPCEAPGEVGRPGLSPVQDNLVRGEGGNKGGTDHEVVPRAFYNLSLREGEILKGVAKGYSNKAIARLCGITDSTIKVHMKSIFRKIRRENRTQAAVWAHEQGYGDKASDSLLLASEGKASFA